MLTLLSPYRVAMRLSLVGLARKVASSHTDPVCLLQSGLQIDITSQLLPIIGDEKPCAVFFV